MVLEPFTQKDFDQALEKVTFETEKLLAQNYLVIGIQRGGYWLAQHILTKLNKSAEVDSLNINFYRDDASLASEQPTIKPSIINNQINNRDILLIDDVVESGRTIRAALNELFDYGRPASVKLLCLIHRTNSHQLPIQPDIAGISKQIDKNVRIDVHLIKDGLTYSIKPYVSND